MMQAQTKKLARSVSMFVPSLRESRVSAQIAMIGWLRRPARPDVGALAGFVDDAPVILDVGASRGLSIASTLMLKPKAQIVAFEPLADLAKRLQSRYRDQANVRVFACALSDHEAKMEIFIPVYRGCVMDTLAALNYRDAEDWINSDRVFWFDKDKLAIERRVVEVTRLDDMGLKPDIMKIYAQSHEPEVIAGAVRTIRQNEPAILAPCRIPRVDACLRDLGYARCSFRERKFHLEGEGDYYSWYLRPRHKDQFIYPWVTSN